MDDDEEESKPEEIRQRTQIKRIIPDKNGHYEIKIENQRKTPKPYNRDRFSGHNNGQQLNIIGTKRYPTAD